MYVIRTWAKEKGEATGSFALFLFFRVFSRKVSLVGQNRQKFHIGLFRCASAFMKYVYEISLCTNKLGQHAST